MYYCRFLDGQSCLGILKAIREFPVTTRSFFIYEKTAAPTTAYLEEMFLPIFSKEGSNKYIEELRIQSHWRDFLDDLAGILAKCYSEASKSLHLPASK